MNVEEIKRIKAKSDGTTLYEHTCMVIETGLKLLQSLSLSDDARTFIEKNFLQTAILHDLGKVHPTFQKRLNGDKYASIRHELVSVWFAETFLEMDNAVLFAIATHHKSVESRSCKKSLCMLDLNGISISIDEGAYLRDSEGSMCMETLQSWLSLFLTEFVYRKEKLDRISSNFCYMFRESKQKKVIPCVEDRQRFSLMRAFLQAADHLASGGKIEIPDYQILSLDDFQPCDKSTKYPFRHFQEKLQQWKGDAILHAPTGSGKTEAALSWVYANQSKGNRLFYLLPYTASINAMMTRLCKVYDRSEVMIQHSKSLNFIYNELCEEYSSVISNYAEVEQEARSLNSLSREVYYPIKIMTLHQLLRIPCHGKGWEFSMLECQNALFIIDEFHAYNAFLTGKMLGTGDVGYTVPAEFVYPKYFHKKGALSAARQGDNVNPKKESSGCQFYIVTGKVFNDSTLLGMESQMNENKINVIFNTLAQKHMKEIYKMRKANDENGLYDLQEKLFAEVQEMAAKQPEFHFTPEQIEAYTTVGGTPHLDGEYTVFGEVVKGLDIVDKIQQVKTDRSDRPEEDVKITKVTILD